MCEPDWKAGLLPTIMYLSWCVSLLIVPRLADKFGRKFLFQGARLAETAIYLAILLVQNYWAMLGLMIGLGLCGAGRVNVGTVYLTEWFPRKNQTALHMVFAGEVALGYIAFALYFWFWGNNAHNVSIIAYSMSVVSVALTFILPDSPRLLAAKGSVEEFQKALDRMAWFNRTEIVWREEELRWIDENQKIALASQAGGILKFLSVDVLTNNYTIELTDLPADADEPKVKKMLKKRLTRSLSKVKTQKGFGCITVQEVVPEPTPTRTSKKKKSSFKVSFKDQAEMIAAIQILRQRRISQDDYELNIRPLTKLDDLDLEPYVEKSEKTLARTSSSPQVEEHSPNDSQ